MSFRKISKFYVSSVKSDEFPARSFPLKGNFIINRSMAYVYFLERVILSLTDPWHMFKLSIS